LNVLGWAVWGFGATVILTVIMAGAQSLGLTRMALPFMLGSMFTVDIDKAKLYGMAVHMMNGLVFSLIYIGAFHLVGEATWYFGAAIGLVHALFVITAGMEFLPALHPRMASENRGPTVTPLLEPPGFLALNYGPQTPFAMVFAHIVFGGMLGTFYPL
jgi:hypothetical protein